MHARYETVPTICSYCGCGCGVLLEVLDGAVVGVLASKSNPVNQGALCIKGLRLHEFLSSPRRLREPLIRRGKELEPAGWDETLDLIAKRLGAIKAEHGPDAVGALCSAKVTNEENYLMQRLIRAAVGTNNIDHCARL